MPEIPAVFLSDAVTERANLTSDRDRSTSRRSFLKRVSMLAALPAALPAAPLALDACRTETPQQRDTSRARAATEPAPMHNPDSRLDTVHGSGHPTTTATGPAANATFQRYDPILPPLPNERTQHLH